MFGQMPAGEPQQFSFRIQCGLHRGFDRLHVEPERLSPFLQRLFDCGCGFLEVKNRPLHTGIEQVAVAAIVRVGKILKFRAGEEYVVEHFSIIQ